MWGGSRWVGFGLEKRAVTLPHQNENLAFAFTADRDNRKVEVAVIVEVAEDPLPRPNACLVSNWLVERAIALAQKDCYVPVSPGRKGVGDDQVWNTVGI